MKPERHLARVRKGQGSFKIPGIDYPAFDERKGWYEVDEKTAALIKRRYPRKFEVMLQGEAAEHDRGLDG